MPRSDADRRRLDADFAPKMLREDIAGIEKMLEIDASDPRLHTDLGLCYLEAKKPAAALTHLEEAARLQPASAGAQYNVGTVLLQERKFGEARRYFTEAVRLKPEFAEAYTNLGVVGHAEGKVTEAVGWYSRALRISAENPATEYNLARAFASLGNTDAALEHYHRALDLKPDDAATHSSLATLLASHEQVDAAVAHYRRALELDPDFPAALVDLAWILATSERADIRRSGRGGAAGGASRRADQPRERHRARYACGRLCGLGADRASGLDGPNGALPWLPGRERPSSASGFEHAWPFMKSSGANRARLRTPPGDRDRLRSVTLWATPYDTERNRRDRSFEQDHSVRSPRRGPCVVQRAVLCAFGVAAMCAGLAGGDVVAAQQKKVEASGGWVKEPAAGETTATAFVDVDNPTIYDVYLMSAATDVAGKVEFRDKSEKGEPQGQVKKTVTVPAFGSVIMDPNGVQLLLTDLKRPLKGGDTVSLMLKTDGGVELQVSAAVRKE